MFWNTNSQYINIAWNGIDTISKIERAQHKERINLDLEYKEMNWLAEKFKFLFTTNYFKVLYI